MAAQFTSFRYYGSVFGMGFLLGSAMEGTMIATGYYTQLVEGAAKREARERLQAGEDTHARTLRAPPPAVQEALERINKQREADDRSARSSIR